MIEGKDQKVIDEEAKKLADLITQHYAVETEDLLGKLFIGGKRAW